MFLKPTAKPVPRRTPSPRVVLPAPPGSRSGSRGSGSGARRLERGSGADHLGGRQRAVDPLAGRKRVARRERVQQPELDRVDPERRGELVHLRLAREAGLDGAEAAHRAARRVVRVDDRRLEPRVRHRVGAAGERGGVRADGRRARGVGAAVEQDPHLDGDEPAVARRRVPRPDPRRVAVDVAGERLLAVVDDLHRAVRVQREQRGVDLHRDVLAAAERAADAGEVDAHPLGGRPRHGAIWARSTWSHCVATWMSMPPSPSGTASPDSGRGTPGPGCRSRRRPRRRPRRAASGSPWRIDDRADDVRPRIVAVAVALGRPVGVELGPLGRALHVGHGLERLVLDPDLLGRAARLLGMLGGDERDRLAEVADAVDREHRLVAELEAVALLARARRRG